MTDKPKEDSWTQYQKLVLAELKRHSQKLDSLADKMIKIEVEIAMLKLKASLWGGIAGFLPVIIERFLRH